LILSSRKPQCISDYYKISQEALQRLITPADTRVTTMDRYYYKISQEALQQLITPADTSHYYGPLHLKTRQQYREWRSTVVTSSQCGALCCRICE
jgi:hypothetical protein